MESGVQRYRRGVRNLTPELADRIRHVLGTEPSITKSALARRVTCSRQTVSYYLRAMQQELREAADRNEELKMRSAMTQADLLDQIATAAEEVRQVITELRGQPTTPSTASAIFRGHAVLERQHRLLGELIGQLSPPVVNQYLVKVEALLSTSVDPDTLPAALRTTAAKGS